MLKHEDIIKQLSLKEKCMLLSGKDVWHTHEVERLHIPSMALSDGPSGLRKQAEQGDHLGLNESTKATCVPSASTIANSWSVQVAQKMGEAVGADAADQDVQVVLGPGLNTKRSPLCGRAFEYYSEDPYLSGKLAAAFIRGAQSKGVAACAKHFAANSQELRRMTNDSVVDERTLRELYLTNFEIAVKEGKPRALMTSYNKVNGTYANENPYLYGILRGEWGFDGMVVTDWGGSNDFTEGVRTGMNLEMPAAGDDSPCQLMKAIEEGRISEDAVNERVDQLLDIILADRPDNPPVDHERQHDEVFRAAQKCMVLLKNEENVLPLKKDTKVAVIGDFAGQARFQGAGSSMVNPFRADDTIQLLKTYFPDCTGYAPGFERTGGENEELLSQAIQIAKGAECVLLYLGLPEGYETEGLDRSHMKMPDNQIRLLSELSKTGKPLIVVLSCGCAIEMPWEKYCTAILFAGLAGEAAAGAALSVISGQAVPGGRLSETFPVNYTDLPVSRYYPGMEYTSEYREGLYVGYRYTSTAHKKVQYPFGYGLSYTTFEYSNLKTDESGVSFDVTNTGTCAGDEVVQMYISLPGAKVFRPEAELKGFERITLEAGETRNIKIPFDEYTFRYFNVKTKQFETEGGSYEVRIGASSEDIRLKDTVEVKGTNAPDPYEGKSIACYRTASEGLFNVTDEEFEDLLGHPIPNSSWDRAGLLQKNDSLAQMEYAKNPLARSAAKYLKKQIEKNAEEGKSDLNMLFIYNMPFRGMAKMMNGMVSMDMADDILYISNGHFFRGTGRLIHHYLHRPKL